MIKNNNKFILSCKNSLSQIVKISEAKFGKIHGLETCSKSQQNQIQANNGEQFLAMYMIR